MTTAWSGTFSRYDNNMARDKNMAMGHYQCMTNTWPGTFSRYESMARDILKVWKHGQGHSQVMTTWPGSFSRYQNYIARGILKVWQQQCQGLQKSHATVPLHKYDIHMYTHGKWQSPCMISAWHGTFFVHDINILSSSIVGTFSWGGFIGVKRHA